MSDTNDVVELVWLQKTGVCVCVCVCVRVRVCIKPQASFVSIKMSTKNYQESKAGIKCLVK